MATIVNERDVLMHAAPARVVDVVSPANVTPLALRGISLAAPASAFRIATNGDPSPTAITLTASLKGMDVSTPVTWSVVTGTATLTGTGLSRTLTYANMGSDFVTVSVSAVVAGLTYTDSLSFMKLHDGSVGGSGSRGSLSVARAITGTAWYNTEALAALTAAGAESAISTDTCTLYNVSANFSEMRRYDGTNWVPVGSSLPGSILMTGSVTTEKLLVTGMGIALNSDPNSQDITAWTGSGASIVSDTTAPNGASALQCVGQGTAVLSKKFPLDPSQSYRVRTWAKQAAGTSKMYLAVAFYDAGGALITGSSAPSGWVDYGTYHYYGLVAATGPAEWTEYSTSFGMDETRGIPAGAKYASVGLISNFDAAGTQRVSGMLCHLKTRGEMVVKGTLTADLIDTRGMDIRDLSNNVIFSAGHPLNVANVAGLGAFATLDGITSSNVSTYIADTAIGNAQISELHATKLTARSIKTDRLEVNSVTANSAYSSSYGANMNPANAAGTQYQLFSPWSTLSGVLPGSKILFSGQGEVAVIAYNSNVNTLRVSEYIEYSGSNDGTNWTLMSSSGTWTTLVNEPWTNFYGTTKNFWGVVPLLASLVNPLNGPYCFQTIRFRVVRQYEFTSGLGSRTALNPNGNVANFEYAEDIGAVFVSAYEFKV